MRCTERAPSRRASAGSRGRPARLAWRGTTVSEVSKPRLDSSDNPPEAFSKVPAPRNGSFSSAVVPSSDT